VTSWAAAIAGLHGASAGLRDDGRGVLASTAADDLAETVAALTRHAAGLGVATPEAGWDELTALCDRLEEGPAVLSPGDTCPDNNVETPDGWCWSTSRTRSGPDPEPARGRRPVPAAGDRGAGRARRLRE
jgi:hypothetical protein